MAIPDDTKAKPKFSKSDTRYWQAKVTQTTQGGWTAKNFSIRFSAHGTQRLVTLTATTRKEAATEAKQLWLEVKANGWGAADGFSRKKTLPSPNTMEANPDASPPRVTVSQLLDSARSILVDVRPRSMAEYIRALRTIVSQANGINRSGSGGLVRWRGEIDQHDLLLFTRDVVQSWIALRMGSEHDASVSAKRTVKSILQNAQSLFKADVLSDLERRIGIRIESPFKNLRRPAPKTVRHQSKFDLDALLDDARQELRGGNSIQFQIWKILLLTVAGGLRRGELDRLRWRNIDLKSNCIYVSESEGEAKTATSIGGVKLDDEVVREIERWPKGSPDDYVIPSCKDPQIPQYRAGMHFWDAIGWLRDYEVNGEKPFSSSKVQKPLHELRKEAGSRVYNTHGLHAAKVFLRHDNIETTSRHYLDSTPRFAVEIGNAIKPKERESQVAIQEVH